MAADVTIYHNPQCSTSRQVLAMIEQRGLTPEIVDYRTVGWTRDQLKTLFKAMKAKPRDVMRIANTPAEELGLTDPTVSDARVITAMTKHPILVQRPIVVGPNGAILARPVEKVYEVL